MGSRPRSNDRRRGISGSDPPQHQQRRNRMDLIRPHTSDGPASDRAGPDDRSPACQSACADNRWPGLGARTCRCLMRRPRPTRHRSSPPRLSVHPARRAWHGRTDRLGAISIAIEARYRALEMAAFRRLWRCLGRPSAQQPKIAVGFTDAVGWSDERATRP